VVVFISEILLNVKSLRPYCKIKKVINNNNIKWPQLVNSKGYKVELDLRTSASMES
jgi:hypothetical protein